MTCNGDCAARIAQLEELVEYWKSEAVISADVNQKVTLQGRLGLSPHQAHILSLLYSAGGKPVRRVMICEDMPRYGEIETAENSLSVQIHRIRKRLPDGTILSARGSNTTGALMLSPAGVEYIKGILEA